MGKREFILSEITRMQKEITNIRDSHTNPEEIELEISSKQDVIKKLQEELKELEAK